jgi:pimeloyl-ACP methyl ester carboxylesterase
MKPSFAGSVRYTEMLPATQSSPALEFEVHEWAPAEPCAHLLLVHALSGGGHDFAELAHRLVEHGIRCVAPDMPGHGVSPPLPQGIAVQAAMSRCLFHLACHQPKGPVVYLGTSWGGHAILPILRSGLVRVDGAIFNDIMLERSNTLNVLPSRLEAKAARRAASFDEVIAMILDEAEGHHYQRDLLHVPRERLDAWARRRFVEGPDGWREQFDAATVKALGEPPDPEAPAYTPGRHVARLTCPVLMIEGRYSPISGTRTLKTLLSLRPNLTSLMLEGGHAPKLMTDDQIGAVKAWLLTTLEAGRRGSS